MQDFKRRRLLSGIVATCGILAMGASTATAQSPEEFYKGKTLRFMHVTGAGGTMDLYMLLAMKHVTKHLPQGTNVVLEHRPGGGGLVGLNHLFNVAPKDGTYLGMPTPSFAPLSFSRPEAVRFKPEELIPLGRFTDTTRVFVARGDSKLKSFEDATKIETTHGTMPPGSTPHIVAAASNEVLGTKFKLVPGYTGGGPLFVAMEQGEVQGTTAEPGNLLANKWNLVKNGSVVVLAQAGSEPTKGLEHVPLWTKFMPANHPLRGVVDVISIVSSIGLATFLPPGVPADRVAYLRGALAKTMADPELIAEAKARNIPLDWKDHVWLGEQVKTSMQQPDNVKAWFRNLVAKK